LEVPWDDEIARYQEEKNAPSPTLAIPQPSRPAACNEAWTVVAEHRVSGIVPGAPPQGSDGCLLVAADRTTELEPINQPLQIGSFGPLMMDLH
jgi:hypothetical protein